MRKMAGALKVKYKHTLPIILHADLMDEFKEAINGQDIGVFFREIQEDVVEKYRKEKKVMPQARGALINYHDSNIYIFEKDQKQTTLDIFAKETEVINCMKELKEKHDDISIRKAGRNGQLLYDMCKAYFKK